MGGQWDPNNEPKTSNTLESKIRGKKDRSQKKKNSKWLGKRGP